MRPHLFPLVLIFTGVAAHARVFETRVQCLNRYGKEIAPAGIIMGPESKIIAKSYNTGDFIITAFFRDNTCVEQRYVRAFHPGSSTTMTPREIAGILAAEGGSQKWEGPEIPEVTGITTYTWRTKDGRLTARLLIGTLTITDTAEPARKVRDEEERKRKDQRSVQGL